MGFLLSALRIGIAVAIVNGAGHIALVYWSFYQFQDAAQQLALFGGRASPEAVRSNVFAKAGELMIPIAEEQIVVTRDGPTTVIQAAYVHPVEYFPRQNYPLKLSFNVEGRNYATGAAQ
jgi:hypothetical protein